MNKVNQQIETIQYDIAEDRQRITELENQVTMLLETIKNIKTVDIVHNQDSFKETTESKQSRLYEEVIKKRYLKSKDVMNLLGLKYHTQAYRIMEAVERDHEDIQIVKSLSKNQTVITVLK